jgi:hypothetical protein
MSREKSDDWTMAMRFRSLGMTTKDLDRIAGIGDKFDTLTNNILGHFAGYDSGAYSNVPLEFVESMVRMLDKHGYIDWSNVPRTGPREQFEKYKEKSRGDKRLPPSGLESKVRHLANFGCAFELEDEKDFPTNGFSYFSTKGAYFLKAVFDNATCKWRMFLGEYNAVASKERDTNKYAAEFTHEKMLSFLRDLKLEIPGIAEKIGEPK